MEKVASRWGVRRKLSTLPLAVAALPATPPRFHLPSGRPGALRMRPSQWRARRPTAPARSPKGSPADIQCAAQSPASDAAHHTSGRSLLGVDTPALPPSPATKTAPPPSPAPAAAPSQLNLQYLLQLLRPQG